MLKTNATLSNPPTFSGSQLTLSIQVPVETTEGSHGTSALQGHP